MPSFRSKPVTALQLQFENVGDVAGLISPAGTGSHWASRGQPTKFATRDGREYVVPEGFWVVKLGGSVAVLSPTEFEELFEPA